MLKTRLCDQSLVITIGMKPLDPKHSCKSIKRLPHRHQTRSMLEYDVTLGKLSSHPTQHEVVVGTDVSGFVY